MEFVEDIRHYAKLGFVFTFRGDSLTVMYHSTGGVSKISPVYIGDNLQHAFGACELLLTEAS